MRSGSASGTWLRDLSCAAVLAAVALHAITVARAIASRIAFPMDLEWLESAALEQAWRTVHGGALVYGDPALGWQSQIYPPLYFFLVGALGRVLGLDYWLGRAVSVASFVAALAIIAHVVASHARRRSEGLVFGLAAAGALCASWRFVEGWYDLARTDTLAMTLVTAAAALFSGPRAPSVRRAVVAALLLVAAAYTKQTSVFFAPWLALYAFARDRRGGLVFAGVALGASLAVLAALQVETQGWFAWWVTLARHHELQPQRWPDALAWVTDRAAYLLVLVVLVPLLALARRASRTTVLWWGLLASSFPPVLLAFLKLGGNVNDFIPLLFFAPPVAALLALDLLDRAAERPWRPVAVAFCLASATLYLALHRFGAAELTPSPALWARARALNAFVASREGGVLVTSHPFLGRRNRAMDAQLLGNGYGELFMANRTGAMNALLDVERIDPEWLVYSDYDTWVAPPRPDRYRKVCDLASPFPASWPPTAIAHVYRRGATTVPPGSPCEGL